MFVLQPGNVTQTLISEAFEPLLTICFLGQHCYACQVTFTFGQGNTKRHPSGPPHFFTYSTLPHYIRAALPNPSDQSHSPLLRWWFLSHLTVFGHQLSKVSGSSHGSMGTLPCLLQRTSVHVDPRAWGTGNTISLRSLGIMVRQAIPASNLCFLNPGVFPTRT